MENDYVKETKKLKIDQLRFLYLLYKKSNVNRNMYFSIQEIGEEFNFDEGLVKKVKNDLLEDRLIDVLGTPADKIGITSRGIREIEDILLQAGKLPDKERNFLSFYFKESEKDPTIPLDWKITGNKAGYDIDMSGNLMSQLQKKGIVTFELDGASNLTGSGFNVGTMIVYGDIFVAPQIQSIKVSGIKNHMIKYLPKGFLLLIILIVIIVNIKNIAEIGYKDFYAKFFQNKEKNISNEGKKIRNIGPTEISQSQNVNIISGDNVNVTNKTNISNEDIEVRAYFKLVYQTSEKKRSWVQLFVDIINKGEKEVVLEKANLYDNNKIIGFCPMKIVRIEPTNNSNIKSYVESYIRMEPGDKLDNVVSSFHDPENYGKDVYAGHYYPKKLKIEIITTRGNKFSTFIKDRSKE